MNKLTAKFMTSALALCFAQSGILASMAAAQTHNSAQSHAGMAHLQELEKRFGPHFAARLSSGGAMSCRETGRSRRCSGSPKSRDRP